MTKSVFDQECTGPQCGTNSGYRLGCRGPSCTAAAREYGNERRKRQAYGRWQPWVDAEPVRTHVQQLRRNGMGVRRIVALSGVSYTVVQRLLWSVQGAEPTSKMRPANAAALMSVGVDLAPSSLVPSAGARRRVEALMTLGWSQQAIAQLLGWQPNRVSSLRGKARVEVASAAAVAGLYDRLWASPAPTGTPAERWSSSRTRNYAARCGFVPPLGWDDETIDNPSARPAVRVKDGRIRDARPTDAATGTLASMARAERLDAVLRLSERGLSAAAIAARLGTTERSVTRYRAKGRAA